MRLDRSAIIVVFVAVACSGGGGEPDTEFVAQCLEGGGTRSTPVVCWLDADGAVSSVSDVELANGVPFVVDVARDRVAAHVENGDLVVIDGSDPTVRVPERRGESAFAFSEAGELLQLDLTGQVRDAGGAAVVAFDVDGDVDTTSGTDVSGDRIAFTVARPDGGFAVMVGDLTDAALMTIATSDRYVGQPRFAPGGELFAFVGVDYRSIEVTDLDGGTVATFIVDDPSGSGRVNAPRWLDDDRVMFHDARPALVVGSASTGDVEVIAVHDPDGGAVPVLAVPA